MKEKIFINARIIDPSQNMDEKGSLILNDKGKVKAIGKNVKKTDSNKDAEIIDLKGNILIPGLVDMKAFVGEPGYEYKENFRTLSQAALAGGVTSIVTMPNTKPIIDNVSMVDFIIRRGRDKANVNLFPCASITKQCEGKLMTEFGLLSGRGIIGFSDVNKTIQNTELMSRIMDYASDIGVLMSNNIKHGEGISNSIMEYMANGKPVIVSNNGGNSEIVLNHETGYIIDKNCHIILANKICSLLSDISTLKKFGVNSKSRILNHFNIETMVNKFIDLYLDLVRK